MRRAPVLDRLADRGQRVEVGEQLLIAYAVLDRRALRRIGRVPLSEAADLVVGVVEEEPAAARVDLVALLKTHLRFAPPADSIVAREAVRLARAAVGLSAQELARGGGPRIVASLLRDARQPRHLALIA